MGNGPAGQPEGLFFLVGVSVTDPIYPRNLWITLLKSRPLAPRPLKNRDYNNFAYFLGSLLCIVFIEKKRSRQVNKLHSEI